MGIYLSRGAGAVLELHKFGCNTTICRCDFHYPVATYVMVVGERDRRLEKILYQVTSRLTETHVTEYIIVRRMEFETNLEIKFIFCSG